MKILASSTSERATKGQGGNEYVRTAITVEIEPKVYEEILILHVEPCDEGYSINLSSRHGDELYSEVYRVEKGEKQKTS